MNLPRRMEALYQTHQNFILLLLLFVSFRAFALFAYRPGGLLQDFSDFYWYREYAQLTRQGYVPFQNLWTVYPPLFLELMINLWKVSTLIPPWEIGNFWFAMFLGTTFIVFETGNFILLYLIALKLYNREQALKSTWIYAGLFVPVYTVTGWFESYPIFFFLLSLYLLLINRPYLSAVFTGLGFLVKLIPLILLPVGVNVASQRDGKLGRIRFPALNINFDIQRVVIYGAIFIGIIVIIAFPYYQRNPDLILSSMLINQARIPWETVWALLEQRYNYGVLPIDMRNMAWQPSDGPGSQLPWGVITLGFGVVYGLVYTRHINWQEAKSVVAFTGLTVGFFLLYSKGYSPQWLGWLLIFIALLLPNIRGVYYALVLSAGNFIEANIFYTIFPDEIWLLTATILLRTVLIIIVMLEFCLMLWPNFNTPYIVLIRRAALIVLSIVLLISLFPATRRLQAAYIDTRLTQSPYKATIEWLREQPVTEAILLDKHTTYDWFYPYLRSSHTFYLLDDYADASTTVEIKMTNLLDTISINHQAVWVYDSAPSEITSAEAVTMAWLQRAQLAHQADIDGGRLYLYIFE